jgi:hypothetical protein
MIVPPEEHWEWQAVTAWCVCPVVLLCGGPCSAACVRPGTWDPGRAAAVSLGLDASC